MPDKDGICLPGERPWKPDTLASAGLEPVNDAYERGYTAGLKVGNRNADELLADRNRIARDQADVRDMAELAKRDEQAARDDAHDAREERDALRRALGDLIDSVMGEYVELDLDDVSGPVSAARREIARLRLAKARADVVLRDAAKLQPRDKTALMDDANLQAALGWIEKAVEAVESPTPRLALAAVRGHIEAGARAGRTLGKIIDRQCLDALAAIGGAPDLIQADGDGDWAVVWERLAELRPARDAALAEVAVLTEQRDRARGTAVALEQEAAESLVLFRSPSRDDVAGPGDRIAPVVGPWWLPMPPERVIAPASERVLDALLGFEVAE